MARINYILSVSAKEILSKEESKGMKALEKKFRFIPKVSRSWELSDKGFDEVIYRV